ncbi:response regulator [Curtobacterium flaccumfaciens]|uniref:response regulator n=1 Tax=Curtobacterium flaccumfaciens TaxID=2035 RepID=UPI000FFF65C6|nr:response regulator [Curtobacterium flaccumfaciens]MCS0644528.1 response regulator [Curtobacterium flaccumfaciens pv. flaccumfaciens]MCS6525223.1 response regulator [Curtobacterium flaccumfaciens pv. flaccumfaciens]MCS6530616.1 response regulator [Curtobacterium flaccumfaciens pv. flaccumfaciens]NUU09582.1 response regulator [Curtobacterium flaccumfaciens]RXF83789.1 two-component system response regulator [Curtobacterium flaccumfaciens pv. flaccumfaciens]
MSSVFTVLVVDDDFHVADLHRRQVDEVPGFRALEPVGTLAAARSALSSGTVDLVLVDVYLPDGSGLDLLRSIDTDAFVLSAASDSGTVRRAMRSGALAYLIKPFAAGVLAERLQAYARSRNVLDERSTLDQEAVERAFRILHAGDSGGASPSRAATAALVLEQLVAGEERSAAEVAAAIGVSRATAQRYLAQLTADGTVAMQLRYGAAGRPEHRYVRR